MHGPYYQVDRPQPGSPSLLRGELWTRRGGFSCAADAHHSEHRTVHQYRVPKWRTALRVCPCSSKVSSCRSACPEILDTPLNTYISRSWIELSTVLNRVVYMFLLRTVTIEMSRIDNLRGHLPSSTTFYVVTSLLLVFGYFISRAIIRWWRLPPGPWGYPVLGSLPRFWKACRSAKDCSEWVLINPKFVSRGTTDKFDSSPHSPIMERSQLSRWAPKRGFR